MVSTEWPGMVANPDKYQGLVLGNTDCDFQSECAGRPIPISSEIELLGVTLDDKLKFDLHVAAICRKVAGQVNALNRLKNILPLKTKEALYRAFILPHFYCCSQIGYHCGERNTKKMERVINVRLDMFIKIRVSHMKTCSIISACIRH